MKMKMLENCQCLFKFLDEEKAGSGSGSVGGGGSKVTRFFKSAFGSKTSLTTSKSSTVSQSNTSLASDVNSDVASTSTLKRQSIVATKSTKARFVYSTFYSNPDDSTAVHCRVSLQLQL